jgi:2-polyprenyl-6-methoxyphenol hydroxylase-like FAD-dependent oxidoreductase
MYDAIIVGARCAGAPCAMLLARKGYRVLVVDRATFPSDTLSTHFLWPHGAEVLDRWGLQDALAATGAPAIGRRMTFDVGPFALRGTISAANSGRGGFCPRRTVLDHLLVNAAAASGAELREGFAVEALRFDGEAVVGIRGRALGGALVEERARIVLGADGVQSFVAKAVRAPEYDPRPVAACGYYSYWSGVVQEDIALHVRDHFAFAGAPTHDGLHILTVNWPARDFASVRRDVDGHVSTALEAAPDYAARVRAGRREEPWYGTAGLPSYFRKPYGPGWALVGDAAYHRDPITAQGISDAFIDAEELAGALDAGLSGRSDLGAALEAHEARRNRRVRPMYEFTYELARLEPPPEHLRELFQALRGNRRATDAFLSAITGALPIAQFMAPESLAGIVSAAGA